MGSGDVYTKKGKDNFIAGYLVLLFHSVDNLLNQRRCSETNCRDRLFNEFKKYKTE